MKYDNQNTKQSVIDALKKYYRITLKSMDFKPVGEESYSYLAIDFNGNKYFVKYCERANVTKNIDLVNQLLVQLKDFNFVVPPIDVQGKTSFSILTGKIYVYPYIDGEIVTIGNEKFDKDLVDKLLDIIVKIHSSKDKITVRLSVEDFNNDFLTDFERLLTLQTDRGARSNSEAVSILKSNEALIRKLINTHTKLGEYYKKNKPYLVLTHGDITGRNIILSEYGLKLVDWDGAMISPPERDLNFLLDNPHFSVDEYLRKMGMDHYDPKLKEYYGQQWALGSIIGNLENLLTMELTLEDQAEYIDEAKEYLGYYQ